MLNRFLLILMSSLVLAACGGGGGGGGGSSSGGSDSSDNDDSSAQVYEEQNAYLPLIEGTGWEYDGDAEVTVSTSNEVSGAFELTSVLDDTNPAAVQTITQIMTSTTEAVYFEGLTAENVSVDVATPFGNATVTLRELLFGDDAVQLIGENLSDTAFETDLAVTIESILGTTNSTLTVTVTPDIENNDVTFDYDGQGVIPAKQVVASLKVEATVSGEDIVLYIDETAIYVPGVGIVYRTTYFYLGENRDETIGNVTLEFASLIGIPEPLIFESTNTVIARPLDVTVRTDAVLSPDTYSILNTTEINAENWLTVEENDSDTAYVVDVTNADDVPTATETFVVYLGKSDSSARYPVNVTLIVNEVR